MTSGNTIDARGLTNHTCYWTNHRFNMRGVTTTRVGRNESMYVGLSVVRVCTSEWSVRYLSVAVFKPGVARPMAQYQISPVLVVHRSRLLANAGVTVPSTSSLHATWWTCKFLARRRRRAVANCPLLSARHDVAWLCCYLPLVATACSLHCRSAIIGGSCGVLTVLVATVPPFRTRWRLDEPCSLSYTIRRPKSPPRDQSPRTCVYMYKWRSVVLCRLVCTRVILLFLLSLVLLLRGLPLLRGSSVLRLVLLAAFCPAFRPLPHHNHKPPLTFTSMHASRALAMLCLTTPSLPSPYPLPMHASRALAMLCLTTTFPSLSLPSSGIR